jgi:hypothetical protein
MQYSHMFPNMQKAVAKNLEAAIKKEQEKQEQNFAITDER